MACRGRPPAASPESDDQSVRLALAEAAEIDRVFTEDEVVSRGGAEEPSFVLTDVTAFKDDPTLLVNFLVEAKKGSGLKLMGILGADDDYRHSLVLYPGNDALKKTHTLEGHRMLLDNVIDFSIGITQESFPIIWVHTLSACYEIQPADVYRSTMDRIELAIGVLYQAEDYYTLGLHEKYQAGSIEHEVADILAMHTGTDEGAGVSFELSISACREHIRILMYQLEKKEKSKEKKLRLRVLKLQWTATGFYKWLKSGCPALDPQIVTSAIAAHEEEHQLYREKDVEVSQPATANPSPPESKELKPFHGIYRSVQFPNGAGEIPTRVTNLPGHITEHIAALICHGVQTGRIMQDTMTQETVGRVVYKDYNVNEHGLGNLFVYKYGPDIYRYLPADLQQSKFGKSLIALPRSTITTAHGKYAKIWSLYHEFFPTDPTKQPKVFRHRKPHAEERASSLAKKKNALAPADTVLQPNQATRRPRNSPVPDPRTTIAPTPVAVPTFTQERPRFDPAVLSPDPFDTALLNMPPVNQTAHIMRHINALDHNARAGGGIADVRMEGTSDFEAGSGYDDTYMGGTDEADEDSLFVRQGPEYPPVPSTPHYYHYQNSFS